MSQKKSKSKDGGRLVMLHSSHTLERKSDDKVVEREEIIRDGSRGISFKLFVRDDSKNIRNKYLGFGNSDGTFNLVFMVGGEKEEMKSMSATEMMAKVKSVKDLKFVVDYLKTLKSSKLSRATGTCCPRGNRCMHKNCKYSVLARLSSRSRPAVRSNSRPKSRSNSRPSSRSRKSR